MRGEISHAWQAVVADNDDVVLCPRLRCPPPSLSSNFLADSPRTASTLFHLPIEEDEDDDGISPDEPRYCLCGDVSWGTMIACDNEDCEKEWFHLSCVGLDGLPPRRTKWYCPDCRKKLKMGVATNGLVGKNVGGR